MEGEDKPGEPGRFWRRFSELLRASEEEEGAGEEGEGRGGGDGRRGGGGFSLSSLSSSFVQLLLLPVDQLPEGVPVDSDEFLLLLFFFLSIFSIYI